MSATLISYTTNGEDIIEKACRTCYLSFHRYDPPKSAEELIRKVIRKGHFSVLEHASATFKFEKVSRVMTHELVRHRLKSYSMESQRYCIYADKKDRKKTREYSYVIPPSFENKQLKKDGLICIPQDGDENTNVIKQYEHIVKMCYDLYENMLDAGVPPEDARYILPNATDCSIVVTANLRSWREFLFKRCHPRAHWEIRQHAIQIKDKLIDVFPNVFFDFIKGEMKEKDFINVHMVPKMKGNE